MAARGDYREYCLSLKGDRCEICRTDQQIVVHHLDGDRTNNSLDNLIPVCRKHHAQIHFGSDELKQYTEQLPEGQVHDTEATNGKSSNRKTISMDRNAHAALNDLKLEDESWSDFAWRLTSFARESGGGGRRNPEQIEDIVESISDRTAEKIGERLLSTEE